MRFVFLGKLLIIMLLESHTDRVERFEPSILAPFLGKALWTLEQLLERSNLRPER